MRTAGRAWGIAVGVALSTLVLAARPTGVGAEDQPGLAEANKFFQRGNRFFEDNSLPRAKLEYEKALKLYPQHLDALYNLGVVCARLGQKDEAIKDYQRYLAIRPNDADVWTQIGVLDDETGRRPEAREAYEKALEINPKFGRAHHDLAVLLQEDGDFKGAEQHFITFMKLEEEAGRQNGDAYYSLGVLYLRELRELDAKLMLQKAIDTDPTVPRYNNAMGDTYLLEKRPDLALVYYQKAIEKDPKYELAYSGMGDAHAQLKERDQAAAAYRKALELRPDYDLVHYKLGLLYEDSNPAEAIKQFEKYLQSGKNLEYRDEVTAKIEALKLALKP
ncbi:MAG TPA: tetratricopeptide repeat protein [Verrucomicrobiae bacterium]|nr:tetratricopeptide repeat protein [Verrucomicrobiae bacterium]